MNLSTGNRVSTPHGDGYIVGWQGERPIVALDSGAYITVDARYNTAVEYSGTIAHNAQRPVVRLYSERRGAGFPEYRRNA